MERRKKEDYPVNSLDERLRGGQQDLTRLTSQLRGEGGRQLSVGRRGADTQGDHERGRKKDEHGGDEGTA